MNFSTNAQAFLLLTALGAAGCPQSQVGMNPPPPTQKPIPTSFDVNNEAAKAAGCFFALTDLDLKGQFLFGPCSETSKSRLLRFGLGQTPPILAESVLDLAEVFPGGVGQVHMLSETDGFVAGTEAFYRFDLTNRPNNRLTYLPKEVSDPNGIEFADGTAFVTAAYEPAGIPLPGTLLAYPWENGQANDAKVTVIPIPGKRTMAVSARPRHASQLVVLNLQNQLTAPYDPPSLHVVSSKPPYTVLKNVFFPGGTEADSEALEGEVAVSPDGKTAVVPNQQWADPGLLFVQPDSETFTKVRFPAPRTSVTRIVAGDNVVYVTARAWNERRTEHEAFIHVYTWDGTLVKSVPIPASPFGGAGAVVNGILYQKTGAEDGLTSVSPR